MKNTLLVRAPLRISLLGGGSDFPEYLDQHNGHVLSFSIDKYVTVAIKENFENKVRCAYSNIEYVDLTAELKHDLIRTALEEFNIETNIEIVTFADIPGKGSGLGSSSALAVALAHGLFYWKYLEERRKADLALLAYRIERNAGHNVGKQDHFASACGGLKQYRFGKYHDYVIEETLDDSNFQNFQSRILLLWTGISRDANPILEDCQKKENDNYLTAIAEYAQLGMMAIQSEMWSVLGQYITFAWENKIKLSPKVTNEYIDNWLADGIKAGAYGGKLCGAGGGGYLLFIVDPEKRNDVIDAVGLPEVPVRISLKGSEIIYGTA